MTTHFGELYEPIKQMNEKLSEASKIARKQPDLILAGQMLNQLRVAALGPNFLVLKPDKAYFYKAMLKRQDKILMAIQLVVPEVISIKIMDVS